jgi:hypothetical protein
MVPHHIRTVASAALAIAVLLPSCGTEQPAAAPERPARRPPEQACDQARAELGRESRSGDFLFEESGSAMVDRTTWLRMDRSRQDDLIEKLAVLAGCGAETPVREVEVTIRTETGEVIETRRLPPSTDFRAPPS